MLVDAIKQTTLTSNVIYSHLLPFLSQKLEDNVLKGDEELTVQSEDGKGSEKVTARVRDIVTKSLSDNPAAEVSVSCFTTQE